MLSQIFKSIFLLLVLIFPLQAVNIKTKADRIYIDDKPFFIKGICYSPSYPGQGGGLITFHFLDPKIKENDFKMIKEAGFNTLYLYESMNEEFYSLARKYNLYIIEPILSPGESTLIDSKKSLDEYTQTAVKQVRKMKNNSSIIMWSLWRDAPFSEKMIDEYGMKKMNTFFKSIYDAVKKEDPTRLIIGSNILYMKKNYDLGFKFIDVIGAQSYLGLTSDSKDWKKMKYSNAATKKMIKKLSSISKKYNKPVVITETGYSTRWGEKKQGRVLEKQMKEIGENLAGVCIFEWIDEWWKAGKPEKQDKDIEEYWGITDGYRNPKIGYTTIKSIFSKTQSRSKGFSKKLFLNNHSQSRLRVLPQVKKSSGVQTSEIERILKPEGVKVDS